MVIRYSNGKLIGDITNTESGQLEAEENSSVILFFGSQNGDINNYGNIGGQIEPDPILGDIGEGISGSDIDNTIDIIIPTDLSYAIRTNGRTGINIGGTLYGNINNTGNIFTSHSGIEVFGDMEGTISNSGEITTGHYGIRVSDTDFDGLIINESTGVISSPRGIDALAPNSSIINNGTIKGSDINFQSSSLGSGYLNSYGITVFGIGNGGTITNNGDIFSNTGINTYSLIAENTVINNTGNIESAFTGIDVRRSNINHINNSGSITSQNAIAASDSTIESITNTGSINASAGIYAHSGSIGEIVNTGTITAKEAAISVTPEYIREDETFIPSLYGDIINSGAINLPEYDGKGISVATGNGDITNSGTITATALSEDIFSRDNVNTNLDDYTYIEDFEDNVSLSTLGENARLYKLGNTNTYAIDLSLFTFNETIVDPRNWTTG